MFGTFVRRFASHNEVSHLTPASKIGRYQILVWSITMPAVAEQLGPLQLQKSLFLKATIMNLRAETDILAGLEEAVHRSRLHDLLIELRGRLLLYEPRFYPLLVEGHLLY